MDDPSIPGGVQGQVGWALGSLGWYEMWRLVALPVVGGLELHDPWGPFQPRPFCDSVSALKCGCVGMFCRSLDVKQSEKQQRGAE